MTTKETLHELIDSLSDEEAAELLARVRREQVAQPGMTDAEKADRAARIARAPWAFTADELAGIEKPKGGKTVLEIFEDAWRNMRPEDLENWPSSDEVDNVVYRLHGE